MASKKTYINVEAHIYKLVLCGYLEIVEAIILNDVEHFNKANGFFKKNEKIALELNISTSTVTRKIKNLVDLDLIVTQQIQKGRIIKLTTFYTEYMHSQIDENIAQPNQNGEVNKLVKMTSQHSQNDEVIYPSQNDEVINKNKHIEKNREKEEEKLPLFNDLTLADKYNEYLEMRKEKKVTATETTIKKQVKKLSSIEISDAIEVLDYSVSNGYQGLFFDIRNKKQNNNKKVIGSTENQYQPITEELSKEESDRIDNILSQL